MAEFDTRFLAFCLITVDCLENVANFILLNVDTRDFNKFIPRFMTSVL